MMKNKYLFWLAAIIFLLVVINTTYSIMRLNISILDLSLLMVSIIFLLYSFTRNDENL
jgi:hypothetical protein